MPLNAPSQNPGAAATSALSDYVAERELKQRQAMLDKLTQKQFGLQEQRFAA